MQHADCCQENRRSRAKFRVCARVWGGTDDSARGVRYLIGLLCRQGGCCLLAQGKLQDEEYALKEVAECDLRMLPLRVELSRVTTRAPVPR